MVLFSVSFIRLYQKIFFKIEQVHFHPIRYPKAVHPFAYSIFILDYHIIYICTYNLAISFLSKNRVANRIRRVSYLLKKLNFKSFPLGYVNLEFIL